jgi:hypothetical protein
VPADGEWQEDLQVDVVDGATRAFIISKHPMHIGLSAKVESVGWLACYSIWLAAACALALLGFLIAGNTTPKAFPRTLSIKVASSEKNLARAVYRPLQSLPGGRTGFYRSARVRFGAGGEAIRGTGWTLQLAPGHSAGVVMRARTVVECRQSGKWTIVGNGAALAVGTDYRFGGIHFRLT